MLLSTIQRKGPGILLSMLIYQELSESLYDSSNCLMLLSVYFAFSKFSVAILRNLFYNVVSEFYYYVNYIVHV